MREETRKNIREWLKTILSAVAAALIITQFIIPTSVYGISMEPTFEHEDYLLISKQAYAGNRHPERGDVIVFQSHLKDSESGVSTRLWPRPTTAPSATTTAPIGTSCSFNALRASFSARRMNFSSVFRCSSISGIFRKNRQTFTNGLVGRRIIPRRSRRGTPRAK